MQISACGISNTRLLRIESVCIPETQMVVVGRFGKSVGLKGSMRVTILTDFPEILSQDTRFYIQDSKHLFTLAHIFNINLNDINRSSARINHTKRSKNINAKTKSNSATLEMSHYFPITLHRFNAINNIINFSEITNRNESTILCNMLFYSTIDDTRKFCKLSKDEFFYFDIIGMSVIENGVEIGIVQDIQEIANTHYFVLDKGFMIPYIDRYVLSINLKDGHIMTQDASLLRI